MSVAAVIAAIPTFNQLWPSECPKAIPIDMDFTAADIVTLDMTNQIQQGIIEGVQSCYFDNGPNNVNVLFACPDTGQRLTFLAGFQGYLPLVVGQTPQGTFTCAGGGGIFRIILMNTPVQPIQWKAI